MKPSDELWIEAWFYPRMKSPSDSPSRKESIWKVCIHAVINLRTAIKRTTRMAWNGPEYSRYMSHHVATQMCWCLWCVFCYCLVAPQWVPPSTKACTPEKLRFEPPRRAQRPQGEISNDPMISTIPSYPRKAESAEPKPIHSYTIGIDR